MIRKIRRRAMRYCTNPRLHRHAEVQRQAGGAGCTVGPHEADRQHEMPQLPQLQLHGLRRAEPPRVHPHQGRLLPPARPASTATRASPTPCRPSPSPSGPRRWGRSSCPPRRRPQGRATERCAGHSVICTPLPNATRPLSLGRRRVRLRVEPHRVRVHLAIDEQAQVMRLTLPDAARAVVAEARVLALQRLGQEVVVAFHQHRVVTLGDGRAHPDSLHVSLQFVVGRDANTRHLRRRSTP